MESKDAYRLYGLFPKNSDFKQRQRGRRRERYKIRKKPKGPLRMTGGKQVDVLRSGPTLVKLISCCLKRREIWSELKPVGEHVSTVKYLFESLCK